ncbi:helix-turn-helix transcriptional regulator (plasmid) [Paenibacillus cellulosilyticus]|nr:helix-turn-helix transcriptional regulator [Paenibacillus cellulosilyticus]
MIALRDSNNLTQEQLAEAVGLSQSMIAHIEAGRKEPSKNSRYQ